MYSTKSVLQLLFLALIATSLPSIAAQDEVVHAVSGAVTHVDSAAKTITVKTADGSEQVFKFTGKTTVDAGKDVGAGAKMGAVDSYMKGKEGTHVVVRYVEKGGDKTAVAFKDLGKDTIKVSDGTVTKSDKAGHTITVKAEDGTETTYHVARDASIDTEHGVVDGSRYVAKDGEKVTVHYTEKAGDKVAHFIKHI
jgi:phage baseplate assembly protein gpV